jgi:Polyketide cyclase / dehydrase and lipid transport
MWATEHSIETTASPESIWRLRSDVATWPDWNSDIERIEISGPFSVGRTIAMTPIGQDTVTLRLTAVSEPHLFVDEADLGGAVVRTTHRIDPLDNDRNRVTYRMEITGPTADEIGPRIGPQISSDFPETLAALVARAETA